MGNFSNPPIIRLLSSLLYYCVLYQTELAMSPVRFSGTFVASLPCVVFRNRGFRAPVVNGICVSICEV